MRITQMVHSTYAHLYQSPGLRETRAIERSYLRNNMHYHAMIRSKPKTDASYHGKVDQVLVWIGE